MKKVLFLLHIPPPIHGSSVMGEIIYNSKLIEKYCNKDILNLSTSDSLLENGKYSVIKFTNLLRLYIKLLKKVTGRGYALIYFAPTLVGLGFYKDLVAMVILKISGAKVILHLHNKGVKDNHSPFFNRLYKFFFHDVKVIVLNERLVGDIENYVIRENIIVCPNGIGSAPEKIEVNTKFSEDVFNIIFISNLIESKGIIDVLEACKRLKKSGRNFRLNIIGAEADLRKNDLHMIIGNLELQNYVFYLGALYGSDKESWLRKSNVLVFPSYYRLETFGLVVLEALQHSLPVICTAIDGLDGIIRDGFNGYVVQHKSPEQIYSKLAYLIDNVDQTQIMGINGFLTYCDSYTQSHFEERLTEILKFQLDLA